MASLPEHAEPPEHSKHTGHAQPATPDGPTTPAQITTFARPAIAPAGRTVWHVPVAARPFLRLRFFRLRDGRRCAVGFSSPDALVSLLGPGHPSVPLSEQALRRLAAPVGVDVLVLDPGLIAPPVAAAPVAPAVQFQHG
ncbi:SAV_915 family protein [Kitasatospora sp. NPDC054939]